MAHASEEPQGNVGLSVEPPYLWALGAGAAVFALYAVTLAPTTQFWDTSEYIATAHVMGIPHPPGNPLFVVLARAWELLLAPLGLSVAVRLNLLSAFMSAGAHALWFLVAHHILGFFSADRRFRLTGAFTAVLVSATTFTVWNQSNVNEKVYTVSLLTIALLSWLLVRWQQRLGRGGDDNLLVLAAFILALSVGNHLMAFLAAPAIAAFILVVHPAALKRWKLYPAVLVAGVAGLSIHLFLPLRAALDPVINQANPTCESLAGALTSIVTWGKAGCVALSESIAREQYAGPPGTPGAGTMARQAPLWSQYLNYLQYFDWQWARSLQGSEVLLARMRSPFTLLFAGLGVWGALEHSRRDKASFLYILSLFATLSVGLVFYLNFKYGYSIPAPRQDLALHEVRERDYFFVAGFSVWGLWAGVGIAALWQRLARRPGLGLVRAAPVLALAVLPLALNWTWASRAQDYAARDFAYNTLMSVEPYGVLFTHGDNDTFPLWYLQEVEGLRQDVTVIVTEYLKAPWYLKQLRDLSRPCPPGVQASHQPTRILCQRPYLTLAGAVYTDDPANLPPGTTPIVLRNPVRTPSSSITRLDDAAIDEIVRGIVPVRETQFLQLGRMQARLEEGRYLYPQHRFGLFIVNDSLADRPIHFTSAADATELGLGEYLVRQGLTFRLHNGDLPDSAPSGVEPMPSNWPLVGAVGPWIDVPRTAVLFDEVFVHRGGIPDWDHWTDQASSGVPTYYALGYLGLAQAALQRGEEENSMQYLQDSERWFALGS